MNYANTKVYFDGSHYIGIPYSTRDVRKRPQPPEELIEVEDNSDFEEDISTLENENSLENNENNNEENLEEENNKNEKFFENNQKNDEKIAKNTKKLTKKEFFNELYKKYFNLKKDKRKKKIIKEMTPYFVNEEFCRLFVEKNFERKERNLICRRIRMNRKAYMANFNYFVTFTYDSNMHSEQSFKKKLKKTLENFASRKGWKYMGVWERAPETNRLHFHGLFYIPDGTMPGLLEEHSDYNFSEHKRIKTYQNTFFNGRFGRSDFKEISTQADVSQEITYILKYIEKTEEKIVYSRGLYQYFISDILEEDVVCPIGLEDKKLLLFDDFTCMDEGCVIGKVCPEVIDQMQKCNN